MPRGRARRGRGAASPLFVAGLFMLLAGLAVAMLGALSPGQAGRALSMLSTLGSRTVDVEFVDINGYRLGRVAAYDYLRDLPYESGSGVLSLPEGSYIVRAPGYETVWLHLYDIQERSARVFMRALDPESAVSDIVGDPAFKGMSMIDLNNLVLMTVVSSSVDMYSLAKQYSDLKSGLQHSCTGPYKTPEGIEYKKCSYPGKDTVYSVSVTLVVFTFTEEAFQRFRQAVAAAKEEAKKRFNEELQKQLKMAGIKSVTLDVRLKVHLSEQEVAPLIDWGAGRRLVVEIADHKLRREVLEGHMFKAQIAVIHVPDELREKSEIIAEGEIWRSYAHINQQGRQVPDRNSLTFDWPDTARLPGPPDHVYLLLKSVSLPPGFRYTGLETSPYGSKSRWYGWLEDRYQGLDRGAFRLSDTSEYIVRIYVWNDALNPLQYSDMIKQCTFKGKVVYWNGTGPRTPEELPPIEGLTVSLHVRRIEYYRQSNGALATRSTGEFRSVQTGPDGTFTFTFTLLKEPRPHRLTYTLYIGEVQKTIWIDPATCNYGGSEGTRMVGDTVVIILTPGLAEVAQKPVEFYRGTSKIQTVTLSTATVNTPIVKAGGTTYTLGKTRTTATARLPERSIPNPDGSYESVTGGQPNLIYTGSGSPAAQAPDGGRAAQQLRATGVALSAVGAATMLGGLLQAGLLGGRRVRW